MPHLLRLHFLASLLSCCSVFSVEAVHAQYLPRAEKGNPALRRLSTLDTNNLRLTIGNFGFTGRTGVGASLPFEWPKNTGRNYLALGAMFVGGEVLDDTGRLVKIIDVPAYRSNPADGTSWNFEPVGGYADDSAAEGIARSDQPSTWPASWPDKLSDPVSPGWEGAWNGLLGKNALISGTEFYYHYSDDRYSRYLFHPDTADSSRRGLGIVVSERILAWNDPMVDDAMVIVSDITNVGSRDIQKAAVSEWVVDFVGGDGDSQDDTFRYDLKEDIAYFLDRDGVSSNPAFQGVHVGTPALVFLQSPADSGVTGVKYIPAGSITFNTMADSTLWSLVMTPGDFTQPDSHAVGEYDLFVSSGYFQLPAGGTTRFARAFVFGEDTSDTKRKINYLRGFWNGGCSSSTASVSILAPLPGAVVSDTADVSWDADGNNPSLLIDIFISIDNGRSWKVLAADEPNAGVYRWSTQDGPDGIFYKLRIVAHDSAHLGQQVMAGRFTVNNSGPAAPEVQLTAPVSGETFSSSLPLAWSAGDADGTPITLNIYYRLSRDSAWTILASGLGNTGGESIDISALPNSATYWLRIEASDSTGISSDSAGEFTIRNPRYGLNDSAVIVRSTRGTGRIEPRIADSSQLTGHTYHVEFTQTPDSLVTYDVVDEQTGSPVVQACREVSGVVEGPAFDGLRLLVRNDSLAPNVPASGWSRAGIYAESFGLTHVGFVTGMPEAEDYRLICGVPGIDSSQDIVLGTGHLPRKGVNFTVVNPRTGDRVPFAFAEFDGTDGRFTAGPYAYGYRSDVVFFLVRVSGDSLAPTWMVSLQGADGASSPQAGDTLNLLLLKPFETGDLFSFQALKGGVLGTGSEPGVVASFVLWQNFPNPFNPSTTIRYDLPVASHVNLRIYDLLGREVAMLVDEQQPAGAKSVSWDASAFAGGVYFCRLTAGQTTTVRKMVLTR